MERAPLRSGSSVRYRSLAGQLCDATVTGVRASQSRPTQGIVTFRHEGLNQRGEVVCLCTRQALMLRLGAG